jgi:hypothetical protein
MRATTFLGLLTATFLMVGCQATSGTRDRAATVPAGPVSTASTSTTEIPAGTTLVIRAGETINADSASRAGQYRAEVAEDVVNANGRVLIPRGSQAMLTVLDASGGGVTGTSRLELALSSVNINGRMHSVQTDVSEQRGNEGIGANERTARNVGGGAALGAVIGAIAGGGSGAAVGAAVGAAGGAAAQVLTRGDTVRVPAETLLTFRLDQPMYLR